MTKEKINPGATNHESGTFKEVNTKGNEVKNGREVKSNKGDRMPPTQKKGYKWEKE